MKKQLKYANFELYEKQFRHSRNPGPETGPGFHGKKSPKILKTVAKNFQVRKAHANPNSLRTALDT